MSGKRKYASGIVGDLVFGIRVEKIQEVTDRLPITRVPLAPPEVRGLLNLRGQIVTVVDLRRCVQLKDRGADAPSVHMILRTDEGTVSLLVDRVGDVLEVDERDFDLPPPNLRGPLRELIRGAYKLERGLLLALETDTVLARVGDIGIGSRETPGAL